MYSAIQDSKSERKQSKISDEVLAVIRLDYQFLCEPKGSKIGCFARYDCKLRITHCLGCIEAKLFLNPTQIQITNKNSLGR